MRSLATTLYLMTATTLAFAAGEAQKAGEPAAPGAASSPASPAPPAAPAAPPAGAASRFTVQGTLAPAQIQAVVAAKRPDVANCYGKALQDEPSLAGTFRVRFTIDESGAVSEAVLLEAPAKVPAMEKCLSAAIRKWTFPAPKQGVAVVTYPFTFARRTEKVEVNQPK
jgi:TonB family protein